MRLSPTLKYRGTVKLHGTNSGIVHSDSAGFQFQSRERILTLEEDNAGFMLYMMSKQDTLLHLVYAIKERINSYDPDSKLAIFGEWCGKGIQKGVAINKLDKMFVIFAVRLNDDWVNLDTIADIEFPEDRIFNVLRFGKWELDINFEKPELSQNEMIRITESVEAECPAGKHFGEDGCGEGVVWSAVDPDYLDSKFWFKVKGEKHSTSKVKTLAPIDVEAIAKLQDFIHAVVTENRLEQGLHNLINEQLKPFEMTSLGDFLRWVYNDIMKEDHDTIVANGFDPKKLGSPIAIAAKSWYIAKLRDQTV